MDCPICRTSLAERTHEGFFLFGCATCGGRFLPYESLRGVTADATRPRPHDEHATAMAEAGTAATVAVDERDPLPCPGCRNPMRRYVHQYASGVWVDSCEEHGVWLDAGELERLEAYAEAVAAGMSPRDTTSIGAANVGVERPRIATTPDPVVRREIGTAESVGSDLDVFGGGGMFQVLGQLVDGAIGWRRTGRRSHDARASDVVDAARNQHSAPPSGP